ncbi:hypothetical protein [uncultured Allofournierella sp.]
MIASMTELLVTSSVLILVLLVLRQLLQGRVSCIICGGWQCCG